jgi:hypothetical protein
MPISRLNPVVSEINARASSKTATDAVVKDNVPVFTQNQLYQPVEVARTQNTGTAVPAGTTELTTEESARIDPYNPNSWGSEGAAVPYTPNPAQQSASNQPTSRGNQAGGVLTPADQSSKKNTSNADADTAVSYQVSGNRLSQYNNYTYGLSLHALSQEDYRQLNNDPKSFAIGKERTLISSASRHHATRNQFFTDDFYFNDLKLSTVIGLNATSRSSNAIEISFTIIEPYGMTLINRLLDLSETTLQIENYLQIPYILEIDFFGYNDAGDIEKKITELNKKIPIKLTNMKMRATVQGTEYQITAVPFNHQANFYNTQSLKTTVEVTASTVGEYLNDRGADVATVNSSNSVYTNIKKDNERKETMAKNMSAPPELDPEAYGITVAKPNNAQATTALDKNGGSTSAGSESSLNLVVKTNRGFAAAYNAWYKTLVTNRDPAILVPDEIFFNITSDKIKNARVVPNKKLNVNKEEMDSSEASKKANETNKGTGGTTAVIAGQGSSQTFTVNAGTSIQSVIEQVITNSEFITNQLKAEGSQAKDSSIPTSADALSKAVGNKDINWFKVVPKVELTKFDSERQEWGKKITFVISEYIHYNTSDDRAPKSRLPRPVKDYQYFYTGKNQDVISFDLDFNTLFYTAINLDKNAKTVSAMTPNSNDANKDKDSSNKSKKTGYQNVLNATKQPLSADNPNSSGSNLTTAAAQKNTSFRSSIYNQIGGDMLNLKLNIMGDPDFIKQDDILYSIGTAGYTPNQQFVNGDTGSLVMDRGVILCNVTFHTPSDIDEATGGLSFYRGNKNSSSFSGLYQLIKVTSEFRSGKFTQTLEGFRLRNQPGDGKEDSASDSQRNNEPTAPKNLGAVVQKANTVIIDNAKKEPNKEAETIADETFETPPVATTELRDAPELDPDAYGLQTVVDTAPTVAIGDNSITTGESIIGYSI